MGSLAMTGIKPYEPVPAESGSFQAAEQLALRWLATKRSPHTRYNYGRDLGVRLLRPGSTEMGEPRGSRAPGWLAFCAATGADPLGDVREEHVALWVRGMEQAGLSPATIARK